MKRLLPLSRITRRLASSIAGAGRRFGRNETGVAVIEFAFVLPVMVTAYLGTVALTQGLMTDRKVTLLARTVGDLTAQDTAITSDERTQIFDAARVVMAPYPSEGTLLRMRVSSVRIATNGNACVEWSIAPTGSSFARAPGTDVNAVVPASIRTPSTWLLMAEVEYDYNPTVGEDLTGTIVLNERLFMRPRTSQWVTSFNQPNTPACTG